MLLCPDTLPLYQASRAPLCCRGGSGGRECTRHHPPGPKLLAPHPVKEAPCGEVAVHERVPLLVEETDAGMYGPAGSAKTFVLKVATHESSRATSRIPLLNLAVARSRGVGGDTSSRGQKGGVYCRTLSERRVDSWLRLYNLSRTVSDQL